MKKIYIVFLILLITSCTNLENKNIDNFMDIDKKLDLKLEIIKKDLKNNDLTSLKNSLDVSFIEKYKINKLSDYNLSDFDFYFSKPEIEKDFGKNVIGIRAGEEILYFNLKYKYTDGDWKIIKFEESR